MDFWRRACGVSSWWIGYQTGEEKGEDPDETGERIYT